MKPQFILTASLLALTLASVRADSFGSGGNTFGIDFVQISNPGNTDDAGAGGGIYSSPYGGVPYVYRMAVTEVSQDRITKAVNLGMTNVTTGPWTGLQPAANATWYEAAAFVNFLNISTLHQAAYQLNATNTALIPWTSAEAWQLGGENLYRHKDAYYFLPSEDEWYKAAYHKKDGPRANYWDYATRSNGAPTAVASARESVEGTAVYDSVGSVPSGIGDEGSPSSYGTTGQDGNAREWLESAFDGRFRHRASRGPRRRLERPRVCSALLESAGFCPGDLKRHPQLSRRQRHPRALICGVAVQRRFPCTSTEAPARGPVIPRNRPRPLC